MSASVFHERMIHAPLGRGLFTQRRNLLFLCGAEKTTDNERSKCAFSYAKAAEWSLSASRNRARHTSNASTTRVSEWEGAQLTRVLVAREKLLHWWEREKPTGDDLTTLVTGESSEYNDHLKMIVRSLLERSGKHSLHSHIRHKRD